MRSGSIAAFVDAIRVTNVLGRVRFPSVDDEAKERRGVEVEEADAREGIGLDLIAFAVGLAVAWYGNWPLTTLVWSLWLSSVVIGYGSLVAALVNFLRKTGHHGAEIRKEMRTGEVGLKVIRWGMGIFLLAFFTVHFGGFHWGHSIFLQLFFPVEGAGSARDFPNAATYWTVVKENAWFLPLALIAQRDLFRRRSIRPEEARTFKEMHAEMGKDMVAPYKNVVRLHLLIFFFAFAVFLKFPAALIYVVVYAVYFFPWRAVKSWRAARTNA